MTILAASGDLRPMSFRMTSPALGPLEREFIIRVATHALHSPVFRGKKSHPGMSIPDGRLADVAPPAFIANRPLVPFERLSLSYGSGRENA